MQSTPSGPRRFALVVLHVALAPLSVSAQSDASGAAADLKPGQQVRIQAPGLVIDGARVSEMADGTLYVAQDGQEWAVDVRTIERLEVREHPIVRDALIFGLIGTLAGLGADKFKSRERAPDGVGDGALKGLAAGTAFGVGFGLTEWRWSVRFPR
ncbi:MAG TPA: hypothetical protein VK849_13725 [Longimicrobiales bacterium]|nr:hypothetical protein [Longimicrobiales bacterium]